MPFQEHFNEALSKDVRYAVDKRLLDDPHVKTNLLLQVCSSPYSTVFQAVF